MKKFFLLLLMIHCVNAAPLSDRKEVKTFIQHMVDVHHFDNQQLTQWLNQATIQNTILATIAKPAEALPWYRYRAIFITPKRIEEGCVFWQTHASILKRAEKIYGVPPEIIVAILGVETFYGKQAGQYSVLDSLVTLGFDYPPRSQFFLSELREFLLLAREEKWDPTQIKGSYAGALGKAQFIASSYRRYAVDFNQDGKRDLLNNIDDAIGSVANYFKVHGWQHGAPIALAATTHGDQFKPLIASKNNPKPIHSLKEWRRLGVQASTQDALQPFALIALENPENLEYWLGAQNFYVITRYNHSAHYAMAVYTLSQEIKKRYHH